LRGHGSLPIVLVGCLGASLAQNAPVEQGVFG
jgi:hypothetical protein